ncbi:hypothetical protein V1512DRAFT_24522 [Lipomyces arxii]|uniref:uncharacterized protein n=1 Tax=Lipomyces arxii TaxID=56418 RepID=UPI0034CFFDD0
MTGSTTHHSNSRSTTHTGSLSSSKRNLTTLANSGSTAVPASIAGTMNNNTEDALNVDPVNFETFPVSALRKYRTTYRLNLPSALSFEGELLKSAAGKKTYSYKHTNRIGKEELAGNIKRHFTALPARDSEMIAAFLYTTKHQDKAFKLKFPLN